MRFGTQNDGVAAGRAAGGSRWWWLGCLVVCGLLSGCGPQAGNPRPLDRDVATRSLEQFLTTWRNGGSPTALREQSPSIVVQEPAWEEGAKLTAYQIQPEQSDDGSNLYVDVQLQLERDGESDETTVRYVIGTKPLVSIFRDQ